MKGERKLGMVEGVILLVFALVLIYCNARVWGIGTGLSILGVAMVLMTYSMFILKIKWDDILNEILATFQMGMGAVLILLMVGFIGSSWTVSGTNPMLIYYGLKMVTPGLFLVVAFVLPAICGMATGSAWAIISSVGVALFGVGVGIGANPAAAAAAIASGAYVGDKWSPFSDVPNLAGACTGFSSVEVFKNQIPVEVPSLVITIVLYLVLGMKSAGATYDASACQAIMDTLAATYKFNVLLLLPPIIIIVLAVLKKPTIPVLALSALVAVAEGAIFQGQPWNASFNVLYSGVTATTGDELIDKLLSGGGLTNMMGLILIIFCAFIFAGVIERMGLLKVVLKGVNKVAKTKGLATLCAMVSGVLAVFLTASVYVSTILNTRIWGDVFTENKMSKATLARVLDEGMSNWGMIVPWSSGVAVVVGAFGVALGDYLPFLFSTWTGMLFTLIYGFINKFQPEPTEAELAAFEASEA